MHAKKKAARKGCDLRRLIEGMSDMVNIDAPSDRKNYEVKSIS
jgi:hypothetical protein